MSDPLVLFGTVFILSFPDSYNVDLNLTIAVCRKRDAEKSSSSSQLVIQFLYSGTVDQPHNQTTILQVSAESCPRFVN